METAAAEELVNDAGMEIKEQHRSSAGRDHYAYKIPAKGSKQRAMSQRTSMV